MRWQDFLPTTGDPTMREGEVHGARRRKEAPSSLIRFRIAGMSLEEEAEGQGGQEDSPATNITIRDGDVRCAGGEGDGRWVGDDNGDGSDDFGSGDIGLDDDDDGSDERPSLQPAPSPAVLARGHAEERARTQDRQTQARRQRKSQQHQQRASGIANTGNTHDALGTGEETIEKTHQQHDIDRVTLMVAGMVVDGGWDGDRWGGVFRRGFAGAAFISASMILPLPMNKTKETTNLHSPSVTRAAMSIRTAFFITA